MANDKNYTDVLLEDMNAKMQAVLEIVSDNQRVLQDIPKRDEFNELKTEVATIRAAVTDTNKELKLHDRRITKLENLSHSH
ncbi:hypothetical protein EYC58_04355 [Candidatus Saccharibacteria bacterium]|nr:MAG: hypothetical protein EYC58_04355 [Candidatus Saccharibacteria bacterium]